MDLYSLAELTHKPCVPQCYTHGLLPAKYCAPFWLNMAHYRFALGYPLEESTNKLLNQIMSLFYICMFNGNVSALFHLVNTIKIKLKWKSI